METVITVAAWFVAIPTTYVSVIISIQMIMGIFCKGSKLNIEGFGWVLNFLIPGLAWGWIVH